MLRRCKRLILAPRSVIAERRIATRVARAVHAAPLDPRVQLPAYKNMDAWVDLDRLRALDGPLTEKLASESDGTVAFRASFMRRWWHRRTPGARALYLTQSTSKDVYAGVDDHSLWSPSPMADRYPEVMDFVNTLPFRSVGRVVLMFDPRGRAVPPHRDFECVDRRHEFIWCRTNLRKPFYMLDERTGRRRTVRSYTAWFDLVNQLHGVDACGEFVFSLRVDGVFDDALRAQIPAPSINAASTPSLWASLEASCPETT